MAIEVGNDHEGGGSDFYGGGNSDYLKADGVYHFLVTHATDMPLDRNGGQIINGMLKIQLSVCGGTEKDKIFEQTFFNLKPDASDKQRSMQRRQLMRLAYACNLVGNDEIIAGKLAFEPADMEAHQLIVKVSTNTNESSGKSYMQIHFSDIWHVDDPDAPKDCVLDAEHLAALPDACRRKPEYFAALKEALKPATGGASGNGNGSTANGAAKKETTKPATTKPAKSLSDL
jgi:hypothetical protein